VVADSRRVLVNHFLGLTAITIVIAFGSSAAFTFVFALVVPRDTAFVVGVRIGEARSVILVFEFAIKTSFALCIFYA
jgi:hypothetical protein